MLASLTALAHLAWRYWQWAGSNIGAMPACAAIASLAAVCLRRPLARWWRRHFGHQAELDGIRATAEAAHRIAADLYRHHTGTHHPDAPERRHP